MQRLLSKKNSHTNTHFLKEKDGGEEERMENNDNKQQKQEQWHNYSNVNTSYTSQKWHAAFYKTLFPEKVSLPELFTDIERKKKKKAVFLSR